MSTMTFNTLRAYTALEPRLGAESADALVSAIDDAFTELSSRHNGTLLLKKSKIREELRIEMKDELATKADMAKLQADMASLRGEIQADLAKLQGYVDARFEQVNTRFERLDKKLGRYTTMLSSSTKSHSASYVVPSKGKVVVCMSCLLLKKSGLGHGGQRQFEA